MNSLYARLQQQLQQAIEFLPDKPEETAATTLRALWHCAAGQPCSVVQAQERELPSLNDTQELALQQLIEQRIGGIPLSHITGRQSFMGMELLAGPEALVPRRETEILASAAISLAKELSAGLASQPLIAIDVCTGSGNVALAIARHVDAARVHAADLSESAVDLARRNAQHLGLTGRVTCQAGDLLGPFASTGFWNKVDLLTCNPPYISTGKVGQMPKEISNFEPSLAFDGGPFGVAIVMRLLQEAPRFLRTGGWLAFEVGAGQGPALTRRLEKNSLFDQVIAHPDAGGEIRVLCARRSNTRIDSHAA